MQRNVNRVWLSLTVSAALAMLGSIAVSAQQGPAPAQRAGTRPAAEVLAQIGQSAGVVVLADAALQARLPSPPAPATPETVEQRIAELVRLLPPGTVSIKLYVPAPANGRWDFNTVAEYARAQARLVGTTGRPAPAGMVEILGRPVPADKANEYIAGLNLKLVYLVTNPQAQNAANAVAANWALMSPEQRQGYAQQQAQRILSLDPASRIQMMRQMMQDQQPTPQQMIMRMTMSQMTDDERVQLKQSMAADGRKVDLGK